MQRGGARIGGIWGKTFAGLAFLALALQLMFPAGFMAAAPGEGHGGMPIVICTVQGQMTVDWDGLPGADAAGAHKPKAPAKTMASCPFAGHATASPPPAPHAPARPVAFVRPIEAARPYAVFPGRGLAAPPPPAIGPPSQS